MTREEAWQGLEDYALFIADGTELKEAISMAIEALKREAHDGCDGCPYYHHEPTGEPFCEKDDRRHGTWKDIDGDGTYWLCSVCGEVLCCNNNFCPNCGAKMDGGGDAE